MPLVVKVLQVEIVSERFSLLNIFARPAGLTFWWPAVEVDVYNVAKYVYGSKKQLYFKPLRTIVETLKEKVGLLCPECFDTPTTPSP